MYFTEMYVYFYLHLYIIEVHTPYIIKFNKGRYLANDYNNDGTQRTNAVALVLLLYFTTHGRLSRTFSIWWIVTRLSSKGGIKSDSLSK